MAAKNILVLNGHPDPRGERLCAALANAYICGASSAGHQIRRIDVGALDFPLVRTKDEFMSEAAHPAIREAQETLRWADHLVILYPLWLGGAPALLKGFLEQVFRYGVALSPPGGTPTGLLKGKSARVVVTMGMPAMIFRVIFGAHGLKSLEKGVLWISGFKPIRHDLIGGVEGIGPRTRRRWLAAMERHGAAGT
ncbi:MAG: NAD(P)H-dependent oxidoreductase [Phenylobacterium sp.]|uniref:NAD(P)H-dependent oxidoreductase n=1 Tax=Phenylobacterium sp. TaxID=1871053 RepID=UPI0027356D4D|nr:NAD(P)H-dependent oxidoreductase [Phenylobacterium sp.]MDP3749023.1 NAD(P)H-dependent oxidoreductase [Phenylobacterium sp.]